MQLLDKNGWGLMPYRLAVRTCSGGPHLSELISYVPCLIKEFESRMEPLRSQACQVKGVNKDGSIETLVLLVD